MSDPTYSNLIESQSPAFLTIFKGVEPEQVVIVLRYVVRVLSDAYLTYRMKKQFRLVKQRLHRCEQTPSEFVLKHILPQEARVLSEPILCAQVRFRLCGSAFPPKIVYKVVMKSEKTHYLSGHLIYGEVRASRQAWEQMGTRVYLRNIASEWKASSHCSVTSLSDITNSIEYTKFVNYIDGLPSHLGGRNNSWRELWTHIPMQSTRKVARDKELDTMDKELQKLLKWTNSLQFE